MTASDVKVHFRMQGVVAVLTLNDGARRNALSREMVGDFHRALDASLAEGARALVIESTGAAFCAGANIDDLRSGWMEAADPARDPAMLFRRLDEESRPVVCAVAGPAVGGGFELTLCCDLVVAAPGTWFALPELGHGVIPNTGVAALQRIIGLRRTSDIVLTRRRISLDEAVGLGLVTRAVGMDELLDAALALARSAVEAAPPGAIAAAKAHLRRHAATDWARILASPLDVPKAEWQEGLDAFAERRLPDYTRFWEASAFRPCVT
jgi:enoyl-CoA hydratase/carnithine racemase